MGSAATRLEELITAADDWFSRERQRLTAQFNFLDSISKKRGSGVSLQNLNAVEAATNLEDSINDYLGTPPKPKGSS